MREARYLFPDDRERQLAYLEEHGYFGNSGWEWESPEKQDEYENTRTWSRESYRRATLTKGFAVLNRNLLIQGRWLINLGSNTFIHVLQALYRMP